jgi:hypothetical protein
LVAFVLSLLPVINLRLSLFDTQGERFIYWPSVFTCILIAYLSFILLRSRKLWLVLMLCVLVFYSISLYRANQNWREAADISRRIKDELARAVSPGKGLIIINAPDNLRGAPIFHNGLEEALRVFQKERRIETVRVLSLHDIHALDDRVELKSEGGALTLRLLNQADGFTKVSERLDCVETLARSTYTVRFRLTDCPESFDLFIYNAGGMYRVLDVTRDSAQP